MGIGKQNAKACIDALKLATANKQDLRAAIGEAIDALQAKAAAMDAQLNQASADFATSKKNQFDNFVAALPDVGDPVP